MNSEAAALNELSTDLKRLNWGALALTPLWLFRNGFWLTTAVYMLLIYYYWPLNLSISVLFFIKGNKWSWGNGNRWNNTEEFSESQYTWNMAGKLVLTIEVIVLIITGMMYLGILQE